MYVVRLVNTIRPSTMHTLPLVPIPPLSLTTISKCSNLGWEPGIEDEITYWPLSESEHSNNLTVFTYSDSTSLKNFKQFPIQIFLIQCKPSVLKYSLKARRRIPTTNPSKSRSINVIFAVSSSADSSFQRHPGWHGAFCLGKHAELGWSLKEGVWGLWKLTFYWWCDIRLVVITKYSQESNRQLSSSPSLLACCLLTAEFASTTMLHLTAIVFLVSQASII